MGDFISTFGRGSELSEAQILREYEKFLGREDQSNEEFVTVDTNGNLDLDYEPGAPLFFYNKVKNLQYRLDRLFDKASTLSYAADTLAEQVDGINRNVSTTLNSGRLLYALLRDDNLGSNRNNIAMHFGIGDTRVNTIDPSAFLDPKLKTSMKGKAAVRNRDMGFLTAPPLPMVGDSNLRFSRAQLVSGAETTASDYNIKYWVAGADNKPSNVYRDTKDFFYHSIFLSREHRDSMPEEVEMTLYLEAQAPRLCNYVSARMADRSFGKVNRIELKTEEGGDWELVYNKGLATGSDYELSPLDASLGIENTFVFAPGTSVVVRSVKITFATETARLIEAEAQTEDSLLTEVSTFAVKQYLEGIGALDSRPSRPISGYLYQFAINNVALGLTSIQASAVTSGSVETNSQVSSLIPLRGDSSGFIETYAIAEYFSGSSLVRKDFFPVPYSDDTFSELLFFDSYNVEGSSVVAVAETMFPVFLEETSDIQLNKSGDTLNLGVDYALSVDGGETWITTISGFLSIAGAAPEKLLIGLPSYDLKGLYDVTYKIPSSSREYSLTSDGSAVFSGDEVQLNPRVEYDRAKITLVTILRSLLSQPAYLYFAGILLKND
jgi:hypothetical protein